MGATVKVAAASIYSATKAKNVQESGVQVDMPLGGMNLSVNSTTTDASMSFFLVFASEAYADNIKIIGLSRLPPLDII